MPRTSFLLTLAGIAAVSTPAAAHYVTRCEAIACSLDINLLTDIMRNPEDVCAPQAFARFVDLTQAWQPGLRALCAASSPVDAS